MSGQTYHVVKRTEQNKWAVIGENSSKAVKLFNTQAEAESFARELSKKQGGNIAIHKKDGKFRKQDYS